jgi:ketosteroid isomerase-like protein
VHPNEHLIKRFYTAFQKRDAAGMAECYAPDVAFSDPVFQDLRGPRAGAMWRMLCERGKDLEVVFSDVAADDRQGRAHWDASYTFSQTGRKVLNRIDAVFEFKDGKIAIHRDRFDLYKWMRMALGLKGTLLGWLSPVQDALRRQAMKGLELYIQKNGL